MVDLQQVSDVAELAEEYGVEPSMKLLKYDFVLVSDQETAELRTAEAKKAIANLPWKMQVIDGLPVPDVD